MNECRFGFLKEIEENPGLRAKLSSPNLSWQVQYLQYYYKYALLRVYRVASIESRMFGYPLDHQSIVECKKIQKLRGM